MSLFANSRARQKFRASKRRGVLTLEWVLLITVIVIGIIGGLGAVRNATTAELIDLAAAIESLNVTPESLSVGDPDCDLPTIP
jgi:hypothetical protein